MLREFELMLDGTSMSDCVDGWENWVDAQRIFVAVGLNG